MKTPCTVQCPQCPFRPTALPTYLGDYDARTIQEHAWRGVPFLCHTKVNYASSRAVEKAKVKGKLCLGYLTYANKIMAPKRADAYPGMTDPEVLAARAAVEGRTDVECMDPREFAAHHDKANVAVNMAKVQKANPLKQKRTRSPKKVVPRKPGPPTPEEIEAEIAALKDLRTKIVPSSMFGDDNLALLEVHIRVLEEEMDMTEAVDAFEPLDEEDEDDGEVNAETNEMEERTSDKASAALDTVDWLKHGDRARPSEGWPLLADQA